MFVYLESNSNSLSFGGNGDTSLHFERGMYFADETSVAKVLIGKGGGREIKSEAEAVALVRKMRQRFIVRLLGPTGLERTIIDIPPVPCESDLAAFINHLMTPESRAVIQAILGNKTASLIEISRIKCPPAQA